MGCVIIQKTPLSNDRTCPWRKRSTKNGLPNSVIFCIYVNVSIEKKKRKENGMKIGYDICCPGNKFPVEKRVGFLVTFLPAVDFLHNGYVNVSKEKRTERSKVWKPVMTYSLEKSLFCSRPSCCPRVVFHGTENENSHFPWNGKSNFQFNRFMLENYKKMNELSLRFGLFRKPCRRVCTSCTCCRKKYSIVKIPSSSIFTFQLWAYLYCDIEYFDST